MNRREAMRALSLLPALPVLERHDPAAALGQVRKLGDVGDIVIECEIELSRAAMARLKEQVSAAWPGRRVVVLEKGLRLKEQR